MPITAITHADELKVQAAFKLAMDWKKKIYGRGLIMKVAQENVKILIIDSEHDQPYNVLKFAYAKKIDHVCDQAGQEGYNDFVNDKFKFDNYDLIVVGCSGDGFDNQKLGKLRSFVQQGGWLITTDWALQQVVERTFKQTIRAKKTEVGGLLQTESGGGQYSTISCEIVDPLHPFLIGVLSAVLSIKDNTDVSKDIEHPTFKWWLETGSTIIEILDHSITSILIESEEAKQKWGESPVLVYFSWGNGLVIHFFAHIHLQQGGDKGKAVGVLIFSNIIDELCMYKYRKQLMNKAEKPKWS